MTAPAVKPTPDDTPADAVATSAMSPGLPGAPTVSEALAVPEAQPRNPLHGVTLEAIVTALAGEYGWPGLGERIAIRCFTTDASVPSSLKFLRKTPWAREKVESLYLYMLREQRRQKQYDKAMARQASARG